MHSVAEIYYCKFWIIFKLLHMLIKINIMQDKFKQSGQEMLTWIGRNKPMLSLRPRTRNHRWHHHVLLHLPTSGGPSSSFFKARSWHGTDWRRLSTFSVGLIETTMAWWQEEGTKCEVLPKCCIHCGPSTLIIKQVADQFGSKLGLANLVV